MGIVHYEVCAFSEFPNVLSIIPVKIVIVGICIVIYRYYLSIIYILIAGPVSQCKDSRLTYGSGFVIEFNWRIFIRIFYDIVELEISVYIGLSNEGPVKSSLRLWGESR